MDDKTKTPAELALDDLDQAFAYHNAPRPEHSPQPDPPEYYEYVATA